MTAAADWRPARLEDVSRIARLSNAIHTLLPEREEVFAEKIRLAPAGCLLLEGGGEVLGYVLSHPWRRGSPPALDSLLGELPADADCWYVHDLGIDPRLRGAGAATAAATRVLAVAVRHAFPAAALVAVGGAEGFWQRLGFREATAEGLAAKLREYGADAVYMERPLGRGEALSRTAASSPLPLP